MLPSPPRVPSWSATRRPRNTDNSARTADSRRGSATLDSIAFRADLAPCDSPIREREREREKAAGIIRVSGIRWDHQGGREIEPESRDKRERAVAVQMINP